MEQSPILKRALKSRLLLVAMLLVAVVALLVALSPYIIRSGIERGLVSAGAEGATVKDVDFNPFSGTIVVQGLGAGREGAPELEADRITIRFAVWPLFSKRLVIKDIGMEGARIGILRAGDGTLALAGLRPGQRPGAPAGDARAAWLVRINGLEAKDTVVRYVSDGTGTTLKAKTFKVSGPLTLSPGNDAGAGMPVLGHAGAITLEGLEAASRGLRASEKRISWKGSVSVAPRGSPSSLSAKGVVKGSGPTVELLSSGLRLSHNGLEAELDVKRKDDALTIAKTAIVKGVRVESRSRAFLDIETLATIGVGYGDGRITIGSIELDGLKALLRVVPVKDEDGKAPVKTARPPGGRPGLSISRIKVGEGSTLGFEDLSVTPPYRTTITLSEAEVSRIDTARPTLPSPFTLEGAVGEYTELDLSGIVQPFAKRLTLELAGRVQDLDLPPLSSYTATGLGYRIKSGHLSGDLVIKVVEGEMDGRAEVEIKRLDVAAANEGAIARVSSELGMPLPTALDLLRDRTGDISLKVPVRGDISDPRFGLRDAINKAVVKATGKATISYLKYYFQPYGALITVAELAGKAARVRLAPVAFQPGHREPDPAALAYLERVAGFMKDRPKVGIKVCGVAAATDLSGRAPAEKEPLAPAEEEGLKGLALERSRKVKEHLVTVHGIAPERLFVCAPELDRGAKALGRVELLI